MTQLVVGRVTVGGAPAGIPARVAAEALVRAMAPAGPDRRVLVVRRLRLAGFAGDQARDQLARAGRQAVRPSLVAWAAVAAGAPAVWFADEAEALACLTADLVDGMADARWYWRNRLPRAGRGLSRLAELWLRDLRQLPAALRLLTAAAPSVALRAAGTLSTGEAGLLSAALLPGTGSGPAAAGSGPTSDPDPSPVVVTLTSPSARSEDRWSALVPPGVRALPTAQRTLLAAALVLAAEPAAPVTELRRWAGELGGAELRRRQSPSGLDRADPAGPAPSAQPRPGTGERPMATGRSAAPAGPHQPGPAPTGAPSAGRAPSLPRPAHSASIGLSLTPAIPAGSTPPVARPAGSNPAGRLDLVAAPDGDRTTTRRSDGPTSTSRTPARPAAYEIVDRWPDAVWSECATACYLLNLLLRTDEEPDWADLYRLGRRTLRGLPGVRRRARDPLWLLLTDLAGTGPIRLGATPPSWRAGLDSLAAHGLDRRLFAQPGRLVLTRTHLDVVLDLEQTDLAVRRAGLDLNPGWVRSLGRVVSFHFESAGPGRR